MNAVCAEIVSSWLQAATPPPELTVSQWADERRFLPETSAARGARWRTELTPYLRGIMDAVHEPGVSRIALRKAAQVGGSEALHNIIGYFMEHQPCPMLLVHPTVEVAEEWSKERLNDMLQATPALGAIIDESLSTLTYKVFPAGFLALGGGNTPNAFARRAVRIAMLDDADRIPAVVGEEGDPVDLVMDRTLTFEGEALGVFVSTPALKGGRIDTLYDHSDQRRYIVTCPSCGREDWITWSDAKHFRVVWDERDPTTARLECPSPDYGGCGFQILEPVRRMMVAEGDWRPTAEPKEPGLVGFHLPAMISTLGNVTLEQLVAKFLSAHARGKESLRVFTNTTLGEGWEERGARMQPNTLMLRRKPYGVTPSGERIEVPAAAAALTAGVDVQDNRFELQVIAWGPASERWVVDWRAIPGDPRKAETQSALLEALRRRYRHQLGPDLPIHSVCIDTGYATDEMYDFVLANEVRKIYATKGFAKQAGKPIVGKPSETRYGKRPRPVRLYPINVDDAKTEIIGSLTVTDPGPGYTHFPADLDAIDEEYFAQLCAEHRETVYNRGGIATHTVWVLDRERNEALDTAVLSLAAFKLLNPNIRQMLGAIAAAATTHRPEPPPSEGDAPGAAPATAQPQPRPPAPSRVGRSNYLGR